MIAKVGALKDAANVLRRDVLKMTTRAGSGHPTSCMSAAEIMSTLFFDEMAYDRQDPKNLNSDEFILSKGHAAPILYACLFRAGCIKTPLSTLRRLGSPLEGHPVPSTLPWVKVGTGSLGQGLSVGVGMALASRFSKSSSRVYVLMGDSEVAEGSVYEAAELASYYSLNNLCAIVDVNRLGQRGETMLGHKLSGCKARFKAFGWDVAVINGHDVKAIQKAFRKARSSKRPFIILAKTLKGKGAKNVENKEGWHGKALPLEMMQEALDQIPDPKFPEFKFKKVPKMKKRSTKLKLDLPKYKKGELIATRQAYGETLARLARRNPEVIAVDGEVSNSTYSQEVKKKTPNQFVEAFIAEQNMVGMALGLSVRGYNTFTSTFSAFFSRAHDQIRMAAVSSADMNFCGSHAGVSIGEDGGSQMGLEDIAMFRALPGSMVFYPSDAVAAAKLTALAAKTKGICYLRTSRPKTPVIYNNAATFPLGKFKVLVQERSSRVVLASAGVTLHEALKAQKQLKRQGIAASVVDIYCIKPFDKGAFVDFVKKNGSRLIVVEDHYKEGGMGEMLCSAVSGTEIKVEHLAITSLPHSGKAEELLNRHGINAKNIVKAAERIVR